MFHNALSEQVAKKTYLSASGAGATAASHTDEITVSQSWDVLHRMTTQVDDSGNMTQYAYDKLHRKVQQFYGDGTTETWTFNGDGELEQRVDQTGYVFAYSNDPEGRMLAEFVVSSNGLASGAPNFLVYDPANSGLTMAFTYDAMGRVWTHAAFNGPGSTDDVYVIYFYDSLGRQTFQKTLGIVNNESIHEYQGASRLVCETYPSARKVWRRYDGLDRLVEVRETNGVGAVIAQQEYIGGRVAWMQYGNGTILNKADPTTQQTTTGALRGYDANRRHVRHQWKFGATQITGYVNTYNATNRRVSETREHFSHTDDYTFDSAYRMLSFRRDSSAPGALNGILSNRSMDGADKMLSFNDEGVARFPQVDLVPAEAGLNQYSGFNGSARIYNKQGSLIERVGAAGMQRFGYDTFGRIVSVSDVATGDVALYFYDAENRRIVRGRSVSGVVAWRQYHYDLGWRVLEERALGSNLPAIEYVDGSGFDEHLQMRAWTGTQVDDFFYHCNSQGFVGGLTDAAGARVINYEYSWFGEPSVTGSGMAGLASQNSYMFQGRR